MFSLTRCDHKEFTLYFEDDGSHVSNDNTPYGRSTKILMDGWEIDEVWGDPGERTISEGRQEGDVLRSYIFVPIDTTGSLAASSL